jgi:acetyltransferase-like isoleucine patch superfamily enzyme
VKTWLKRIAHVAAALAVSPALLLYGVARLLVGPERAFPGWSQALAILPGLTGSYLRRAFYRLTIRGLGSGGTISFGTVFSGSGVEIGHNVFFGLYCVVGEVTIEDDVMLASGVSVMNGRYQHGMGRPDRPIREQEGVWPRIRVGRGSWVGERAIVMADVRRHCVVGAGSVVTRPIPDYAVAVGVPARVIRFRDRDDAVSEGA